MHKDDLKKKIVEMLGGAEIHGYEIQKKLESKDIRLNLSYLYRVLAEMERDGYVESTRVKSEVGPEKKVYKLRKKGLEELDEGLKQAVKTIHLRYVEYLDRLPPQKRVVNRLQRLLDTQMGKCDEVLVVAPRVFYDWMVSSLCERFEKAKVYLIKPKLTKVSTESENLVVFDTSIENILLKDESVDAVRVHGKPANIHAALKEFHRVLRKSGCLAMVLPHFHPVKSGDFMTMGEFVEKVEHDISASNHSGIDYPGMKSLLSRYFRSVKRYRLAHLAILVANGKK